MKPVRTPWKESGPVFNDSVDSWVALANPIPLVQRESAFHKSPGWFGPGISLDPRSSNADLGGKCVRARRQLPRCSTRSRPYSPPRSSTTSGCRPYRSKSRCNRPYPARQQRGHVARRRPPNNLEAPGLPSKGRAPRWRYRNAGRSPPSRPPSHRGEGGFLKLSGHPLHVASISKTSEIIPIAAAGVGGPLEPTKSNPAQSTIEDSSLRC